MLPMGQLSNLSLALNSLYLFKPLGIIHPQTLSAQYKKKSSKSPAPYALTSTPFAFLGFNAQVHESTEKMQPKEHNISDPYKNTPNNHRHSARLLPLNGNTLALTDAHTRGQVYLNHGFSKHPPQAASVKRKGAWPQPPSRFSTLLWSAKRTNVTIHPSPT